MSSTIVRRYGAALVGGALAVSLTAAPAQAHEDPDRLPKAIGTTWLSSRLDDGLLHAAYDGGSGAVSYNDYGGTVEAAYALDAIGRTRLLPRITGALAETVDSYITGADFGAPDDHYAGPTGKLLSFVSDLGGDADPAAFGGTDLVARMEALTGESGRIADAGGSDFANVYGQTWAARGLLNVGSPEAEAAVDFLLTQQCSGGHFLSFFTDTCDGSAAGPDATAFAVVLLHEHAAGDPELAAALAKATDWLVGWQARNGSLSDDNGIANANSTGLGGWAFSVAGRDRAAKRAAIWLRSRQVPGRSCDKALAGERGAIAYDKRAYAAGRRSGISALVAGEWQTVAAQALPALAHAPSTHVPLAVDAPERVEAGSRVRVRIEGLAEGERACVGIGRRTVAIVGGREGDPVFARVTVRQPAGKRAVKVLTADDTAIDRIVAR
ncbi:hypothetical protein [Nocardioides antri]|uniref:Terpene cyclase/mutase family protein n=1 Tax=Nocardioides antri TaxID=2607659 RepID=A0A5B1LY98_9ACTN|nr:hypothetical protein [Nocardioides antri]KAA1425633.1 hypothetical protein F0U47_17755 [Nocardioides antri]